MKRRTFLKSLGAVGATVAFPALLTREAFIRQAYATPALNEVVFTPPTVLPQVINIFLYGGPSELAGNLTNIDVINANSQNPYPNNVLTTMTADPTNGQITANGFWRSAGGAAMEDMLASGDMSVYRTMNRRWNNTRAHRPSIFSCLTGNLDIETSPGMGATLAAALYQNRAALTSGPLGGRDITEMVLPFVSFEGESTAFIDNSDNPLPLEMRPISLTDTFDNPYSRNSNSNDVALEALVSKIAPGTQSRFSGAYDGFETRRIMESLVSGFSATLNDATALPLIADVADPDRDAVTGRLVYPNTTYTSRIKAAVTLAIANPDSLFITVGGGLGGWDDHDSAIQRYVTRMDQLMRTLRAAMKHIRLSARPGGTDNIIINVYGDFGRNVNLNNSQGWDHGNNQNLYTFGGAAVRMGGAAALGKVVGKTEWFGDSGQNRQFTRPTSDSYEFEPQAIASTVYSYFGIQNPQVLTRDSQFSLQGEVAINETVAGEAPMF